RARGRPLSARGPRRAADRPAAAPRAPSARGRSGAGRGSPRRAASPSARARDPGTRTGSGRRPCGTGGRSPRERSRGFAPDASAGDLRLRAWNTPSWAPRLLLRRTLLRRGLLARRLLRVLLRGLACLPGGEARLQGFHDVDDLALGLGRRRDRDVLTLHLALDQLEHPFANLVAIVLRLERVARRLADEL